MTDITRPTELTCDEVRERSGAFVLGALDDEETAVVRRHLATCHDAHAEMTELAEVLPVLAASLPVVEPPAGLKSRLLEAAATEPRPRTTAPATPVPATPMPLTSLRPAASRRDWALRIAAVIAIVVLGGWNLLLQGQLRDSQAYEQQVASVVAAAAQPGSLTVVMTAQTGSANGLAAIDRAGRMTLAIRGLAPVSGGAVYEAWVVVPGTPPMPLGELAVTSSGTATMDGTGIPASPGVVVALTREPGPGAKTPTLPIITSGVATAAG